MKVVRWLIIMFCAAVVAGCSRGEQTKLHQADQTERDWRNAVEALAHKHNASVDWESRLPKRGLTSFTIDVSRALIRSNGQPVLLIVDLLDVCETDGGYVARFGEMYGENQEFRLAIELECTREQAEDFMRPREHFYRPYALIARVTRVSRTKFEVKGEPSAHENDLPNITLEPFPRVFSVAGVCVDFVMSKGFTFSRLKDFVPPEEGRNLDPMRTKDRK